jgi:cyanophycin synthetase
MPTPRHVVINDIGELEKAASAIGFPCVVKPLDMGGGKGVTAGIQTVAQLRTAYEHARAVTSRALMVEQFVPGDDHRLMVIDGKFVAAIRREPSSVVGDGKSTIRQLIDELNADRSCNLVKSGYLLPVPIDDALASHLARQEARFDSVLQTGSKVTLRSISNLSAGGIGIDVTNRVHPQVAALAEQLAITVGLGTAGLDYLTTDIGRSPWEVGGAFIEMNTTPGLDVTIAAGWPPGKIGAMVLGDLPGRIPVDLFVMPTLDIEAACLAGPEDAAGPGAAWVCGNEIRVGQLTLRTGDSTPWAAVQGALRNKTLTSLRIVCTVGEILNHGLPLDKVDRVLLCGVALPDRWQGLIERSARSVEILS